MVYNEPSAVQLISYIAKSLGKGAILADWEIEEYLTPLGCSIYNIKEALNFISRKKVGNKILMKEGNVYTVLEDPKNILCHVPVTIADNLEEILMDIKSKK